MARRDDAPRDLLFGLLALQNGLVTRDQLVAAFAVWTATGRPMADVLAEQGVLDPPRRALMEALLAAHLNLHAGDLEKSLAALDLNRSTFESLAAAGGAEIEASLAHVGIKSGSSEADHPSTYTIGSATSDGQRFRVLRPHARGGLGAVFVALDSELNREVALKQILDHHADEPLSRQRFLLEAEITGGLEHPGIVPVYGLGTYDDGRPYYAMRFIKGDSLRQAIERYHKDESLKHDPGRRSLELRKLLRRFTDICNAIEYAHSRGVLHRDIKPGNVIVGKHGETLVIDWGMAKPLGQVETSAETSERTLVPASSSDLAVTITGSAVGTPSYMSPEAAAGKLDQLGTWSDAYSLGATLYCLLTGRPPFQGDTGEILRKVRQGDFSTPRQLDPSIDPALEAICLRAMSLKPEERYPSCRGLSEDIERWMADEPVSSWREPWTRSLIRWLTRHRTGVAAVAATLVVGTIGLAGVLAVQTQAYQNVSAALADTRKAQIATKAALTKSDESRKQAEAVSTFLVETFRSPDPSQQGADLKVVTLLDGAVKRLDNKFAGDDLTKGTLLDALGHTYEGLGEFNKAVVTLEKAGLAFEKTRGSDAEETLQNRLFLASVYTKTGKAHEAIAVLEPVLKVCEQKFPASDERVLLVRYILAIGYLKAGLSSKAFAIHEDSIREAEAAHGPNHRATLSSRANLGDAYETAGLHLKAIQQHQAVLKAREAALGPDDPDTLSSRDQLAIIYRVVGNYTEAIAMHEGTLTLKEKKFGPDQPETLETRNNLAFALRAAGQFARAIAIYEPTLKLMEVRNGPKHPATLTARNNLALCYMSEDRVAEALPLLESVLEARRTQLSENDLKVFISLNSVAYAYAQLGRGFDAIAIYEPALARMEKVLSLDDPETLSVRNNLARAYLGAGRRLEAIALAERNLTRYEGAFRPDAPQVRIALDTVATTYEALDRWADAEPLRRRAAHRQPGEPDGPSRALLLAGLGKNLLYQGKLADSEAVLREASKIADTVQPDARSTFEIRSLLGQVLTEQTHYTEAEPLVVSGYEGLHARQARIPANKRSSLTRAAERIMRLYESWGQTDQAKSWKQKLNLVDLPDDVIARP
jgi:serine/threonine protein kinase/tetratricopeptide (TPR) repeat protein